MEEKAAKQNFLGQHQQEGIEDHHDCPNKWLGRWKCHKLGRKKKIGVKEQNNAGRQEQLYNRSYLHRREAPLKDRTVKPRIVQQDDGAYSGKEKEQKKDPESQLLPDEIQPTGNGEKQEDELDISNGVVF